MLPAGLLRRERKGRLRRISMGTRTELLTAVGTRYRAASRREKARILDEFVAVTGYHRKHVIRLLRSDAPLGRSRAVRNRLYDEAVRQALIVLWEASDRLCGKRLKAAIPILISAMERYGHLDLHPSVKERLLQVSAATIDRLLSETRRHIDGKRRRTSGVGAAIRRAVPVRTFSDWGDPPPGFFEIDMVEHCGGTKTDGNFVHTLTLTDIASAWTECIPMPMRNQSLIVEALDAAASYIPFAMLGIDSDNDGAFINQTLLDYCKERGLAQTRSRPYRKNDQAWVEQKNGAVVRKLVGYERLAGLDATRTLAKLYAASRLYINYFQPSFKLKGKKRDGAHVAKSYHPPATPYARLMDSLLVGDEIKAKLKAECETLDPMALLRDIRTVQQKLHEMIGHATAETRPDAAPVDIQTFLSSLATAWKSGEVRPNHQRKAPKQRSWRTRRDPLAEVWPSFEQWLLEEPTLTAKDLLERLLSTSPDAAVSRPQLRTLQRRIKAWRADRAKYLVLGQHAGIVESEIQPNQRGRADGGGKGG
ncbi:MAG: DDE-type integrase/transposase/recombinase [Vulcanimicrobiaceae bacterium]